MDPQFFIENGMSISLLTVSILGAWIVISMNCIFYEKKLAVPVGLAVAFYIATFGMSANHYWQVTLGLAIVLNLYAWYSLAKIRLVIPSVLVSYAVFFVGLLSSWLLYSRLMGA